MKLAFLLASFFASSSYFLTICAICSREFSSAFLRMISLASFCVSPVECSKILKHRQVFLDIYFLIYQHQIVSFECVFVTCKGILYLLLVFLLLAEVFVLF